MRAEAELCVCRRRWDGSLTPSSSAVSAAGYPMRTVRGRALPVSSGQSPMPSIWRDYAAWRANESSCATRQNALVSRSANTDQIPCLADPRKDGSDWAASRRARRSFTANFRHQVFGRQLRLGTLAGPATSRSSDGRFSRRHQAIAADTSRQRGVTQALVIVEAPRRRGGEGNAVAASLDAIVFPPRCLPANRTLTVPARDFHGPRVGASW